jgi:hypothetical protein
MTVIRDGNTHKGVMVDADGRAAVESISTGPLEHRSTFKGDACYFYSSFATGGTDVEVISIQNTETSKKLHITRLQLSSSVAQVWDLVEVTSGTPAGTTLTYVNPNFASGVANSNTSFGNAAVTGSVAGDTLTKIQTVADDTKPLFFEGSIVLGKDDTFAISASANGTVYVTVIGFWK